MNKKQFMKIITEVVRKEVKKEVKKIFIKEETSNQLADIIHEVSKPKQNVKYTECYGFEFTGTSEIKEDGRWNEFIRYAEECPRYSTNTHKKTDR